MKRVAYVDLLESLRVLELDPGDPGLLAASELPRKRELTKKLDVKLTPEQRKFLKAAAARMRGDSLDESAVVALALAIVEQLDLPWETIGSREELLSAARRRLKGR